jgi:hypothetical protein
MDKKRIYTAIIVIFFMVSVGGLIAQIYMARRNPCDGISLETLKKHILINEKTKILDKKNYGKVCEVILNDNDQISICYATKEFTIKGAMFIDNKNSSVINLNNFISSEYLKLKKEIDAAVCIHYKPSGEIRHTISMFENPDCTHCRDALLKLRAKLDKYNTELKILFFVTGDARLKSIDMVCRNISLDSFIDRLYSDDATSKSVECKAGTDIVDKATSLGHKLFITGVPVFFLENGMMVQGDNVDALEEVLKK